MWNHLLHVVAMGVYLVCIRECDSRTKTSGVEESPMEALPRIVMRRRRKLKLWESDEDLVKIRENKAMKILVGKDVILEMKRLGMKKTEG